VERKLEGERILCVFRKLVGPFVIAGTGRHKSQRATIQGLPAVCILEKEWQINRKMNKI